MFSLLELLGQYVCFFILHVCGGGAFPKPLPEKKEREYLLRMKQGDLTARGKLIEHNLRLVAHIIKKYYGKQGEQDDLVSIGTIGLIKAIDTFDTGKNIRLSSYASRCIENEILMHFRAQKKHLTDISMNEPTMTDKDGNALTLLDTLEDGTDIEALVEQSIHTRQLYRLLAALEPREREILTLRYGLYGTVPLTQKEVAARLGISRSYVSRIEKRALGELRAAYQKT